MCRYGHTNSLTFAMPEKSWMFSYEVRDGENVIIYKYHCILIGEYVFTTFHVLVTVLLTIIYIYKDTDTVLNFLQKYASMRISSPRFIHLHRLCR
jgi:hypothetical protein